MTHETRPRWTGQGNRMCGLERLARYGRIQPMQVERKGLIARILGRGR